MPPLVLAHLETRGGINLSVSVDVYFFVVGFMHLAFSVSFSATSQLASAQYTWCYRYEPPGAARLFELLGSALLLRGVIAPLGAIV